MICLNFTKGGLRRGASQNGRRAGWGGTNIEGLRRGLKGGLRRGASKGGLEGGLEKGLKGGLRRRELEFSKGASRVCQAFEGGFKGGLRRGFKGGLRSP